MTGVELTDLATQGLVAVHDALGIAGGTRGEGDQRRFRRVGVHGAPHGFVGEQIIEIASDESDDRNVDDTGPRGYCIRPNCSVVMNTFGLAAVRM